MHAFEPGTRNVPKNSAGLPHSPRRRRPDLRIIVGVVLLLAGVGGTVGLLEQAGRRTPVLVTTRPIQPGEVIAEADIVVLELGLSPGVRVLRPADRDLVVGRVAAIPLPEGQILSPGVTATHPPLLPGEVAVSVAVDPAAAVGGMLQPGHRVQVLAAQQDAAVGGAAVVVADAARVLAVSSAEVQGTGATVTLAVSRAQASAVAGAGASGSVALVLLPDPASDSNGREAPG